jgi:type I restriction enzyme M protein
MFWLISASASSRCDWPPPAVHEHLPNAAGDLLMPSNHMRRQIELVWEEFWRAGMYDSVEIMEQILYLLFLRRLDHQYANAPDSAARPHLSADRGPTGVDEQILRWSGFRHLPEGKLFSLLVDHVYPRLRGLGGPGSAYAQHLKDVRFSIPTAAALTNVVRLLEGLPLSSIAGSADPFDYMADKLARVGRRGDSQTPRPVERFMVAMVAPEPDDIVCSPVSGAGNFLVATAQYLLQRYPTSLDDPAACEHFHHRMFHAYDADKTMLRIACLHMLLRGVKNPNIRYTNTVAPDISLDEGRYSVILAHPSTVSLAENGDHAGKTRAEALMATQFLRMLKPGGRAAVIVSEHILRGSSDAELDLRRMLVQESCLFAVIALPPGDADVCVREPKSILLFTRTDCGGAGPAWPCAAATNALTAQQICLPTSRRAGCWRDCLRADEALRDPSTGEGRCDQCVGPR